MLFYVGIDHLFPQHNMLCYVGMDLSFLTYGGIEFAGQWGTVTLEY